MDPLNISVENVVKGEAFHIANEVTTFPKEFNGAFGIALVNENNEIKEVLQIDDIPDFVDNGFPYRGHTINFTNLVVTKDIDSTDRLQLITKKRGEDSYRLVLGTIEHQSYIGVVNNTPDLIDLNISIGPGDNFSYNIYGKSYSDYISLEEGYHEVKNVPKGLLLELFSGPKIEEKDRTLIVNLKGDYIYGSSQNFRVDYDPYPIGFCTTLYSSYEINARLYDLLDVNINVEKSGTLKEKLSDIEKNSIRELTISGTLNAVDLWYIRDNCPSLEYLDIKNVIIEGVVAEDSKMTQFDRHPDNEANTIPEFGLASLKSLRTLLLPESITGICNNGLCDLSLQSITIPAGVTNIGLNGLWANEKLNSVELLNPEPILINDCVLSGTLCPVDGILYVPEGTLDKYKNTPIWQNFKEIREEKMPVFVNSIKVFPSYYDAYVGDCFQVETTVFPKNAMDKTIIWSSSDPSIASVDLEGNITVNDIGNVDIIATAADGSETNAVCHVTATERPKVEFIELSIVTWNGFE